MKTIDARTLPPTAQADLRRKAIQAVRQGKSKTEIAELLGVSRQAVYNWIHRYEEGGARGLNPRRRGRKSEMKLLPWQAATTVRLIKDRYPDQLHLPFYLWTREAVQSLIRRKFQVEVSIWTVGRYLKRWGMSPQKPAKRALEQNPQEVRDWLDKKYPRIKALARREKAEIYWEDEMGLRSDHTAGRSYAPVGKTPVRRTTGNRFGCNMISAITNRGQLAFMVFRGRFATKTFLGFLRRLVRQAKRKVFLIVDGHPVHKANRVKAWIAENRERIRMFYLPAYSPELNPDEYLNQDVKSNAVGRRRARDGDELITNTREYLRSTQKQPSVVKNYFQAERVRYAAG